MVFFFNDTATTEIYTLSLHDALPIYLGRHGLLSGNHYTAAVRKDQWPDRPECRCHRMNLPQGRAPLPRDRKSTRLNSSHANISYAAFCLKKKNDDWL